MDPLIKMVLWGLLFAFGKYAVTKIVMWWKNTFFHSIVFLFALSALASAQEVLVPPDNQLECLQGVWLMASEALSVLRCGLVGVGFLVGLACARAVISRWSL